MTPTPAEIARAYHATTKHHPQRYARSLGYMDWDSQPDPFRRYPGAAEVELALGAPECQLTQTQAARGEHAEDAWSGASLAARVGRLLELSMGLTAWKRFEGSRWSLRANPSSGNLHPTEAYVVVASPEPASGLPAGVLHYAPHDHLLELRCSLDRAAAIELAASLPSGGCLVGLTSVLWREAWKYGERALRYCALDTGHAIGTLSLAAACVGLRAVPVVGLSDADVAQLLGLDRETDYAGLDPWEREHPELLLALVPLTAGDDPDAAEASGAFVPDPDRLLAAVEAGTWHGRANALSDEHHEWDVIHATSAATRRVLRTAPAPPRGAGLPGRSVPTPEAASTAPGPQPAADASAEPLARARSRWAEPLERLLRARRSAVAMDGRAELDLEAFARLLDACLVRPELAPWSAWGEAPSAHLLLFVHRIVGLERGLYILVRSDAHEASLRATLDASFEWHVPEALAELGFGHLGLFRLRAGNSESVARSVACQQDIAADGVFSLGMLAHFGPLVDRDASRYRRLFWECGLIGQVLYLEAEAAGMRSTGIGCFFDDPVHQLFGIEGDDWQVLYHFTVGAPIDDERLEVEPPYAHLTGRG